MSTTPQTHAVLGTEWNTDVLDTGAIYDEVNRLWDQLGGPASIGTTFDERQPELATLGGGLMRATTLNLIAVARNDRDALLISDTVAQLKDYLPSRTIILVIRQPQDDEDGTPAFGVRVELMEQQTSKEEPSLRFESITISVDVREVGRLASLVSPLLMSELPNYLWWPSGDYQRSPLFQDLIRIVDRLIVDSAQLGSDVQGVTALRELIDGEVGMAVLGDFTWLRLGSWRQLVAQFFDPGDMQPLLSNIDQITIAYADTRSDGSSGFASALLTVGWLGSRLGWHVVDPLERQKSGDSWAPLRTAVVPGTRPRDIQVRLVPDRSPHARFSLRRVELVATGDHAGVFRVERTDEDDLITTSEMPGGPPVGRMVYSRRPENVSMLAMELQRLGHDRVLEDALLYATKLLP